MSTHDQAVLGVLLVHHPALLSEEEVVRQIAPEPTSFTERDRVHVAIFDLARAGLVHRLDRFVFATAAAVRASELDAE